MARARKALVAALSAAVAAAAGGLSQAAADGYTQTEISAIVGTALGAAVLAGWATYKVKNAPASPPDRPAGL